MNKQKNVFIQSEGDSWFLRNNESIGKDRVVEILKKIEIHPSNILEVGCSSGKRLQEFKNEFQCNCFGIDPSALAIDSGKFSHPDIHLSTGTADVLPFENGTFDVIVLGFCLYVCDRSDLFKIAYETDRCLKENGVVVIIDFEPAFPYKNTYAHQPDMFSYKMNYANMFLWNPDYFQIYQELGSHYGIEKRIIQNERTSFQIIQKSAEHAYATNPFAR